MKDEIFFFLTNLPIPAEDVTGDCMGGIGNADPLSDVGDVQWMHDVSWKDVVSES